MLLCNPFGEEASRAHRIFRVLATQLERAGFTAMRFDYSGTGDSGGESTAASLDDWLADIGLAAERLRSVSGAPRLVVVGLRLGATLAALAAARGAVAARHLVLWDPVVDGGAYLRELAVQHRAYMRAEMGPLWHDRLRTRADGTPLEALGTPISDALAAQLCAIDLAADALSAEQISLVTTRLTPELERLSARLPAAARWLQLNESAAWNTDAALNAMTVPMDIVRAIIARIEETST
ncbi:MAG TPA: alpha/beta hydrolase [Kofleriaceae bacterium]|nr:alpha/beta hydrolase [Kofleriaceae bacterium]